MSHISSLTLLIPSLIVSGALKGCGPKMSAWLQLWSEGRESPNRSVSHWTDSRPTALLFRWLSHTGIRTLKHTWHTAQRPVCTHTPHPKNALWRVSKYSMCARQQSNGINLGSSPPVRSYFVFVVVIDSEECEEAYSELLSLYDAKKQQSIPLQTDSAGVWIPCFNNTYNSGHASPHIRIQLVCMPHTHTHTQIHRRAHSFSSNQRQPVTGSSPTVHQPRSGTWELKSCPPPSQQQGSQRRRKDTVTRARGDTLKHSLYIQSTVRGMGGKENMCQWWL